MLAFRLGLVAVVVAGCAPTIPPHSVAVPALKSAVRPRGSVLFVSTAVPLAGLSAALERAVPAETTGGGTVSLGGLGPVESTFRLVRRAARLEATADGIMLTLSTAGEVTVSGRLARCHADDAAITLTVIARPRLDARGALGLGTPRVVARPAGTLRCAGIPVPLGGLFDAAAAPLARAVELALSSLALPLGEPIGWLTAAVATPRTIDLSGQPACLDLAPGALVLAPLSGQGGALALKLGVEVAPRVTLGACPAPGLPDGHRPPDVVVRELQLGDTFQLAIALALPYAELERHLDPALRGRRFGGAPAVTVDGIKLAEASGRTLARVEMSGALNGLVYLWGTPAIATRDGRLVLHVPDLQLAVETRSVLERLRLFLWQLHDGGLPRFVRERLVLDVTDRVAAARRALTGRRVLLSGSPGVALDLEVSGLLPVEVVSRPGMLVLELSLTGRATLVLP